MEAAREGRVQMHTYTSIGLRWYVSRYSMASNSLLLWKVESNYTGGSSLRQGRVESNCKGETSLQPESCAGASTLAEPITRRVESTARVLVRLAVAFPKKRCILETRHDTPRAHVCVHTGGVCVAAGGVCSGGALTPVSHRESCLGVEFRVPQGVRRARCPETRGATRVPHRRRD